MSERASILVLFTSELPEKDSTWWKKFHSVVAPPSVGDKIKEYGLEWINIETYIDPGSIYEADDFVKRLSCLTSTDGSQITKSILYKGYELWWINYDTLFLNFCLPYTQYKRLLLYVKDFQDVYLFGPHFKSLFRCYLRAHGCTVHTAHRSGRMTPALLPFGILLQIILTLLSLPWIIIRRHRAMIFIGDKFGGENDFDLRMKYIYDELRTRKIPFVEWVRSMESWKTVLEHASKRKRPVIYSLAITHIARYLSIVTGSRYRYMNVFDSDTYIKATDPQDVFERIVATQYLRTVGDDIWEIRIMRFLLYSAGVKTAFISTACNRNFSTVLGCKLNTIPTTGILHGFASRSYNVYDFMPTFNGEKSLSVDMYGLWSDWWVEYYVKNSRAYRKDQLCVSGLMRPLIANDLPQGKAEMHQDNTIRVLLVSEIVAVPSEIVPYIDAVNNVGEYTLYIKFRPRNDSFETWLHEHRPDIIDRLGNDKILKGSMQEAIKDADIVIGSQSTGVIEAVLQDKPFVLFNTKKWGDYYDMESLGSQYALFAKTPEDLVQYIRKGKDVPVDVLRTLKEKFFGDPYKNGSKWVVDRLESVKQQ